MPIKVLRYLRAIVQSWKRRRNKYESPKKAIKKKKHGIHLTDPQIWT